MRRDCDRLVGRTGAHRQWIISSGVSSEYALKVEHFHLAPDGNSDDYFRTVVRELTPLIAE